MYSFLFWKPVYLVVGMFVAMSVEKMVGAHKMVAR